jgi:hypothetical protein
MSIVKYVFVFSLRIFTLILVVGLLALSMSYSLLSLEFSLIKNIHMPLN